nr:DNA (cytosine-5-)-methyltransferase [Clostridia bacterium]
MNKMTLGSLFDGSGGFPLGGLISGITPVWSSEIEPFPVMVTTKRLSFMKHYGDVSTLKGGELAPVDIITFGSPCQDMSVAGKREGLDGSRSSLFYEAVRIVKEMRCATDGKYPRYIVWENVPGAFSSNKGADFQSVLEEICSVKGYEIDPARPAKWPNAGEIVADDFSLAWRVFDAQYWGVPQRRKRIYLVADFAGGSAGKILFESEGVSGYSPQGFRSWEGAAGAAEESVGETGAICLNDQGGDRMDVSKDVAGTLRAQDHGHPPCVMGAAGFCTEHSADSRGIGYEEETSPTLRAGTVPAAVYENHSQDTRYTGPLDVAPTVMSTYGTGGNNQPFVVEDTPKTLKIRSGCEGGGKGALIQDNKSATLGCNNDQTLFVPKVYGICSKDSNAMKSENPKSGFYEADTSRTLDGNGGNPSCNQGGMAVVALEGNGARPSHQGCGYSEDDVSFTLNATEQHAVAYGIDRATYNMGQNAKFGIAVEEEVEPTMVAKGPGAVGQPVYHSSKNSFHTNFTDDTVTDTLVATDYKDPPTVSEEPYYIVRRLTPTECARLQGFPDWWCDGLGTDEPTEEDIAFWTDVFETHRKVMGTSSKPKTRNQIIKWIREPHSDSAEYKMWGNGVALPNVCFVLSGIVYYAQFPEYLL